MHRQPWRDAETQYLVDNYRHHSTIDLAAQLKRCVQSVYQKARTMNLKKSAKTKTLNAKLREARKWDREVRR
jgi:hypothetical protein